MWFARLEAIPLETPQMLLLDVLRLHPEHDAGKTLRFLRGDERRLELGAEQFETRGLIRDVAPFWSPEQCLELEKLVLNHWQLPFLLRSGFRDLYFLRQRGSEQWQLLHALGKERLSPEGRRRLREWDDKFVEWQIKEVPITRWGGFVGPPIDGDTAAKMSDNDWLRAMGHYVANVQHRDRHSLRGGAQQLGHVLEARTKEEPERFARLFLERVPLDVDPFYVEGVLRGLSTSVAPSELLFAVVRRFLAHDEPDVSDDLPLSIARALEDRASDGLPDDLLQMLQGWVRQGPPGRDNQSFYLDQENQKTSGTSTRGGHAASYDMTGGSMMDYLNTTRGQALSAIFKTFEAKGNTEARWQMVEEVALTSSDTLRVGGVWELLGLASQDETRAWRAFAVLVDGRPAVLRSHWAFDFLSHSVYPSPDEVLSLARLLMNDPFDNIKEAGAVVACLVALREKAIRWCCSRDYPSPGALTGAQYSAAGRILSALGSLKSVTALGEMTRDDYQTRLESAYVVYEASLPQCPKALSRRRWRRRCRAFSMPARRGTSAPPSWT